MPEQPPARAPGAAVGAVFLVLVAGLAVLPLIRLGSAEAGAALGAALEMLRAGDAAGFLRAISEAGLLPWVAAPIIVPLLAAFVVLLVGRRSRATADAGDRSGEAAEPAPAVAPAAPVAAPPPSPAVALRLLAALQEEARLLDFVREDIGGYSDEQVGIAVRGIHASLRKAIDARLVLEPILPGEDGDPVKVASGFDPASIRLTGRPSGAPPFEGVLRHGGWRAREVKLPIPTSGSDPAILMPAEVEIG